MFAYAKTTMPRTTTRQKLELTKQEKEELSKIANSRKAPLRELQRAKILLAYSEGISITEIQAIANVSRPTIYKCIDKALGAGVKAGLKDYYHKPAEASIDDDAKVWVVNVACKKPKDLGMAAELWTYKSLAEYVRKNALNCGHACLAKAAKATVWRILSSHEIQPHKIRYYLERRDPEFERKMQEVLVVYKEVNLQNSRASGAKESLDVITVSVDEKPGVQAIKSIAPELPPRAGKYKCTGRDYEYKRLGTVSILAALDLHTGKIIAQVHDRHRSREFIELLREIDHHYPQSCTIRIVLDNHSSHISKETMKYLESRPGRFVYVHTPKHGSWLNLIEMAFSKMARTFLRHIRVSSKQELKERILLGISEFNSSPVVFRWNKVDLEIQQSDLM